MKCFRQSKLTIVYKVVGRLPKCCKYHLKSRCAMMFAQHSCLGISMCSRSPQFVMLTSTSTSSFKSTWHAEFWISTSSILCLHWLSSTQLHKVSQTTQWPTLQSCPHDVSVVDVNKSRPMWMDTSRRRLQ